MNSAVQQVMAELEEWGRVHDRAEPEHGRRMLNLEPDTARLLRILVQYGRRMRLLEFGTSNGYSTLWLAEAVQESGGHVTSVDRSKEKQAMADANLVWAGLRSAVTLLPGDALDVAAALPGVYDFRVSGRRPAAVPGPAAVAPAAPNAGGAAAGRQRPFAPAGNRGLPGSH